MICVFYIKGNKYLKIVPRKKYVAWKNVFEEYVPEEKLIQETWENSKKKKINNPIERQSKNMETWFIEKNICVQET